MNLNIVFIVCVNLQCTWNYAEFNYSAWILLVFLLRHTAKVTTTRRVAVCLETHCSLGSKRAFTTDVLDRWHNCLLIYWCPSCLAPALTIPSVTCLRLVDASVIQFSLLFFNISLTRLHQSHIYGSGFTSTAAYYCTISDNRCC